VVSSVLGSASDNDHPDRWGKSDGSGGIAQADKFGEAKAMLAAMISAAAEAFLKRRICFLRSSAPPRKFRTAGFRMPSPPGISRARKGVRESPPISVH
jgi:hypothetical protein